MYDGAAKRSASTIPIDDTLPSQWKKADTRGRSGEVCYLSSSTILKRTSAALAANLTPVHYEMLGKLQAKYKFINPVLAYFVESTGTSPKVYELQNRVDGQLYQKLDSATTIKDKL